MVKMKQITAAVMSAMLLMTGCASETNKPQNQPTNHIEEKSYQTKLNALKPIAYGSVEGLKVAKGAYISIIGRNAGDSYWTQVEEGARQAVADLNEELGYTGSDKIRLNYSAPKVRDDVNEQINILDEELARYPIAVGMASTDMKACQVQFDLAMEDGIPIVAMDSGSDYKDVAATCATNNLAAGKTAAVKMADALEESGEVAVFVQDSISMTAKQREQGFLKELKENHPNVKVAKVYRFDELSKMAKKIAEKTKVEETSITQADVITWILEKNPNLTGIYTTNLDVTQEVIKTMKNLERTDLKVIGFDGGKEQLQYIEDGLIDGLIVQNPFGMGYATVIAIARAALGMGNEAKVDSGYTWVTKDNLSDNDIQKMLYE